MEYREQKMNLFDVDKSYTLCHCISKDCELGKGIARVFAKEYPRMKPFLKDAVKFLHYTVGDAIRYDDGNPLKHKHNVINLITKEKYWHKPTYHTLKLALFSCKVICKDMGITKLAMPYIGCGLDRLKWEKVREIIKGIFDDTDIEILVCYL